MRPIFTKTLYDSRKLILWFFIGYALYGLMIGALYPFMADNAENYNAMIESMPREMFGIFGVDPTSFDLGNLGTYLHLEMMLWLLIIAGAVGIHQAFNAFTNAERDHSLDMLLSLPLSRRDNLIGQFTATVVTLFISLFGGFLGVVVCVPMWKDVEFSVFEIAVGILGAMLPLLVVTALSYLLAVLIPSSKRFAGAIAYVFWIGSYMVYGIVSGLDSLDRLRPLFVYHYYNAGELINDGINLGYWALLLAATALLLGLAWWRVEDKELGI